MSKKGKRRTKNIKRRTRNIKRRTRNIKRRTNKRRRTKNNISKRKKGKLFKNRTLRKKRKSLSKKSTLRKKRIKKFKMYGGAGTQESRDFQVNLDSKEKREHLLQEQSPTQEGFLRGEVEGAYVVDDVKHVTTFMKEFCASNPGFKYGDDSKEDLITLIKDAIREVVKEQFCSDNSQNRNSLAALIKGLPDTEINWAEVLENNGYGWVNSLPIVPKDWVAHVVAGTGSAQQALLRIPPSLRGMGGDTVGDAHLIQFVNKNILGENFPDMVEKALLSVFQGEGGSGWCSNSQSKEVYDEKAACEGVGGEWYRADNGWINGLFDNFNCKSSELSDANDDRVVDAGEGMIELNWKDTSLGATIGVVEEDRVRFKEWVAHRAERKQYDDHAAIPRFLFDFPVGGGTTFNMAKATLKKAYKLGAPGNEAVEKSLEDAIQSDTVAKNLFHTKATLLSIVILKVLDMILAPSPRGAVPLTFQVQVDGDNPSDNIQMFLKVNGPEYTVVKDFDPEGKEGFIALKDGDVVKVTETGKIDEEWWFGGVGDCAGRPEACGLFPKDNVASKLLIASAHDPLLSLNFNNLVGPKKKCVCPGDYTCSPGDDKDEGLCVKKDSDGKTKRLEKSDQEAEDNEAIGCEDYGVLSPKQAGWWSRENWKPINACDWTI